jgi:hypothetical protein
MLFKTKDIKNKGPHQQNEKWGLDKIMKFNILLIVHHVMILGKWPTWRKILIYVFILTLHVSSTLCSSSGEINCINTTSGICHSVSVTVSCAGRKIYIYIYIYIYIHTHTHIDIL